MELLVLNCVWIPLLNVRKLSLQDKSLILSETYLDFIYFILTDVSLLICLFRRFANMYVLQKFSLNVCKLNENTTATLSKPMI